MKTTEARKIRAILVGVFAAVLSPTAGRSAADGNDAATLDWETTTWRYCVTFDKPKFTTPHVDKWGSHEYLDYVRGWHIAPMWARVYSADAPRDWMKADFDDSSWPRDRKPKVGEGWHDPIVRVKHLRGKFEVPDPARVSKLDLEMEYVGGVVAYLNGQEVGRSHLPPGELTREALGQGYPLEAYAEPGSKHGYGMAEEGSEALRPTEKALALRHRRLAVALEPKLLRKGVNVLAVAFHQSSYHHFAHSWSWEVAGMGGNVATWRHLKIKALKLRATPSEALPVPARPPGVQAWMEDIHRRLVPGDHGETDNRAPVIRLAGARNGTYSGQVVVGTSKPLTGLSARMSDLVPSAGSGKIPAGAVRIRYAAEVAPARKQPNEQPEKQPKETFFERLAEQPPASVAPGRAQPIWVTLKIPKDAPAGWYRGTLVLQADGSRSVEVRLYVVDEILPDPKDFVSFVGLEHSLWGPCAEYKVAAWSEDHWRFLERTVRWLAELGNDIAILPLICNGEAGNAESLVPWVKKNGGYDYDWRNLDRYLDLVARHWGTKAAVVAEIGGVPYGDRGWVLKHEAVTSADSSGKKERLALPKPVSEEWKNLFVPFAKAVRERVRAKGFESLHWGWFHDNVTPILEMVEELAAAVPDVGWARSSHEGRKGPLRKEGKAYVSLNLHIRAFPMSYDNKAREPESRRGWKQAGDVSFPRAANEIMAIAQFDWPMSFRLLAENALVNGAAGIGRLGADYWPSLPLPYNYYGPSTTSSYLLHSGPEGAEGSVSFEALREGIQETEVRIRLEREGKDKLDSVKPVLDERVRRLWATEAGMPRTLLAAYYGGWQERSWDLYAAASAKPPDESAKRQFFGPGAK